MAGTSQRKRTTQKAQKVATKIGAMKVATKSAPLPLPPRKAPTVKKTTVREKSPRAMCVERVNREIYADCQLRGKMCPIVQHCEALKDDKGVPLTFDPALAMDKEYQQRNPEGNRCARKYVGQNYQAKFDACPPQPTRHPPAAAKPKTRKASTKRSPLPPPRRPATGSRKKKPTTRRAIAASPQQRQVSPAESPARRQGLFGF